jgi:hypothetical protein
MRKAHTDVVGDDQQVAAERHVGAAGDAEAVHLAHHRLVGVEEAHEAAHVARHHLVVDHRIPHAAGIVIATRHARIERRPCRREVPRRASLGARGLRVRAHPLGAGHQVVPAAEPLAVPRQRDHVHGGIEIRALDALRQLDRQIERDAVAALRPIEGDARDAPIDGVGHGLEGVHAPVLAPPGSQSHALEGAGPRRLFAPFIASGLPLCHTAVAGAAERRPPAR